MLNLVTVANQFKQLCINQRKTSNPHKQIRYFLQQENIYHLHPDDDDDDDDGYHLLAVTTLFI